MVAGTIGMVLVLLSVRKVELRSAAYRFPALTFQRSQLQQQHSQKASSSSLNAAASDAGANSVAPAENLETASTSTRTLTSSHRRITMNELPKTRRVAYQAYGYTAVFLITYLFPTTSRIIQTTGGVPPYWVRLAAVTMVGSQGFWNFCVYFVLPRLYQRWLQNYGSASAINGSNRFARSALSGIPGDDQVIVEDEADEEDGEVASA